MIGNMLLPIRGRFTKFIHPNRNIRLSGCYVDSLTVQTYFADLVQLYTTIKNLDLVSHLSLHVVLLEHDRYNGSDLVQNMNLDLHVVDVLDCILVINIIQTTSFVSLKYKWIMMEQHGRVDLFILLLCNILLTYSLNLSNLHYGFQWMSILSLFP